MNRTAFAACAAALLSLLAVAAIGCGDASGPTSPSTTTTAPGLLSVPAATPHSWKRLDEAAIVVAVADDDRQDDVPACDESSDKSPEPPADKSPEPPAEASAEQPAAESAQKPEETNSQRFVVEVDESEVSSIAFAGSEPHDAPISDDAAESSREPMAQSDSVANAVTRAAPETEPEPDAKPVAEPDRATATVEPPHDEPALDASATRSNDTVSSDPVPSDPISSGSVSSDRTPSEPVSSAVGPSDENRPDAEPPTVEFRADAAPAPIEPQKAGSAEPKIAPLGEDAERAKAVERTVLPWAKANPRTPEMLAVIQRADQRVRHGFQMADRGAHYSARADFTAALQLIAQANDAQQNTRVYTRGLSAGLTALKEAGGFMRLNAGKGEVDIARVVAGHKTPILKGVDTESLTPMLAAQRYYAYAQEQLSAAAAREVTGSMALFGLAKIVIAGGGQASARSLEATAQATTLYHASLMTDSNNFLAANELGVLLAESGNLSRARQLLIHSVTTSPRAVTWQNLSVIHGHMGEAQLAHQAHEQSLAMKGPNRTVSGAAPEVEWLDAASFTLSTNPVDGLAAPAAARGTPAPATTKAAASPTANPTPPAGSETKKGITAWLPTLRR